MAQHYLQLASFSTTIIPAPTGSSLDRYSHGPKIHPGSRLSWTWSLVMSRLHDDHHMERGAYASGISKLREAAIGEKV